MRQKFGYQNDLAVPCLERVVVNVGLNRAKTQADGGYADKVEAGLKKITGQKPFSTVARKSIASFNIREGMVVGKSVTLQRDKMYDFVEKLINVALPRTRDFRGLDPRSVDQAGNLSIGIKEYSVFPEINPDEVEIVFPLGITLVSSCPSREEGLELFRLLGIPFKKD